jgi:chromosome segregation ATPase
MVIHKTAAEIRVLREALEAASNQVQHKEDQIRARDEQLELALAQIASLKTTVEETGASLNTFKMLFWGLIFLLAVRFVALIQIL